MIDRMKVAGTVRSISTTWIVQMYFVQGIECIAWVQVQGSECILRSQVHKFDFVMDIGRRH